MERWKQSPPVLQRKCLLTFLVGIISMVIGIVVYLSADDRILLIMSGVILCVSLIYCKNIFELAVHRRYEIVEGICTGISTPMLRRYRKIQLMDEKGAVSTLLLSKSGKFRIGSRYRFYFQKDNQPAIGNDYLDAALSTNSFLGYEELPDETEKFLE